MANELLIKKRIKVVEQKMAKIIQRIRKDYKQGSIKSPAELQHRISSDLQAFYDSVGESTLEVIKAWGPPYSKDHNAMVQQIYNDIETIYEEVISMTNDLIDNFQQVEIERKAFDKRITEAENVVKGIALNIQETSSKVIFRDNFVDLEHFESAALEFLPVYISTSEALMTLNRVVSETFNEYASIQIKEGNGLPGNTHVVRSTGSALKFDGEDGLHINLADVIDRNLDTWFEYEAFDISETVREKVEGKGLGYNEPIEWVTTMYDGLYLTVVIELSTPKSTNWFSLAPYIPHDKGSYAALFERIEVSDGMGTVHTLAVDEMFNGNRGFLFPRLKCKTITIKMRQRSSYDITVGHLYFKQINTEEISILENDKEQQGILVSGKYPSLSNLNITYDTGIRDILYPPVLYGDVIFNEDNRKTELFTTPNMPTNIHAGIESIPAQRYMIGLRDATVASYRFADISEYISKPFVSENPIKEIELDVQYDIPKNFPTDQDWIEFYISIDKGQNWNRIYPRNFYQQDAKTRYLFNSGTPMEARVNEVGYLDTLTDIHELQFRMLVRRPQGIEDADFYTPVVYDYEIHALTQGEIGK